MTSISPTGANGTNSRTSSPPTIAVIGGGPGAMFFCHALELQKKELISKGEDVSRFPIARCFERSGGPGGVWRSDRSHEDEGLSTPRSPSPATVASYGEEKKENDDSRGGAWKESPKTKLRKLEDGKRLETTEQASKHDKTNMYSALWTNGPKEQFEMPDYTFKDHFGNVEMPTFLPRKYVLEYLLGRVTKNCPDFFERYFSFGTSVENVKYLGDKDASSASASASETDGSETNDIINNNKFRVCILDETTGIERVEFFDKCIWAAGQNGFPQIPRKPWKIFTKGGFTGRMVHSSDTSTFKEDVDGKNVLMIGGGFSAEDLTLMAIKEGASRIYISCRYSDSEVVNTSRWPYDKVEVYAEKQIASVSGNEVTLSGVYYCAKRDKYVTDDEVEKVTLSNIDTVIFCTGYNPNLQMLDQALQDPLPDFEKMSIPSDWIMNDNAMSQKILGETYKTIKPENNVVIPSEEYPFSNNLYKGAFCIDNPNMMYAQEYGDGPLMSIDIFAWMLAKVVTNQIALPSAGEMRAEEHKKLLEHMNCPTIRYVMDWKYQRAIDDAVESDENLEEVLDNEWDASREEVSDMQHRILGEVMNTFGYPVSYLSPDGTTFSKYREAIMKVWSVASRECLHELTEEKNADGWRSFRDYPDNYQCTSYFTGLGSKVLPKPWMEIDENEKLW